MRLLLRACAAAGLLGCGASGPTALPPPAPAGSVQVLFVGNSLTYFNDVPTLVNGLARSVGDSALGVSMLASPDYAIEDHLAEGRLQRILASRRFDYVVLQQGPSSLESSRTNLIASTTMVAPLIRAAGGTPVLYQVWPHVTRRADASGSLRSYRDAAAAVNGILAPAGDAWTRAFEGGIAQGTLYDGDGLHAKPLGSYLAAIVILERLRGHSPTSPARKVPGITDDTELVARLQAAARAALDASPERP
ncbi:MAG: hypothetical protein K2X99_12995 [Gemmatimonadaceae bacterium]|nr:hypothetical protein [Gemmatimonadaceae bacterium]